MTPPQPGQRRPWTFSLWGPATPKIDRWIRSAIALGMGPVTYWRSGDALAAAVIMMTVFVLLRFTLPADVSAWWRTPAVRRSEPQIRPQPADRYEERLLQSWLCAIDVDARTVAERLGLQSGRRVSFREGLQAATSTHSPNSSASVFVVEYEGQSAAFSGTDIGLSDWHVRVTHPRGAAFCANLNEKNSFALLSFAENGIVVRTLSGDPDAGLTRQGSPRPGEPELGDDARYEMLPWWQLMRSWGGLDPVQLAAAAPEGTLYERRAT